MNSSIVRKCILVFAVIFSPLIVAGPQRYTTSLCNNPAFYCIRVQQGETWNNLFPNENHRELVMRLNRMNTRLFQGLIVAVPKDLSNISLIDISPFPKQINSAGKKLIYVDPKVNAWAAYNSQGNLVNWGPASTGRDYCSDIGAHCHTVDGTFAIYRKAGGSCVSTKFPIPDGGAPMPYCMFFHEGYALHGSSQVPGYNASHGCVRLYDEDAEWLNRNFVELGPNATRVVIAPYADPTAGHEYNDPEQWEED